MTHHDDGISKRLDGAGYLAQLNLPSLIAKSSESRQQFEAVQFLARHGTDEEERLLFMNKIRCIANGTVKKKQKTAFDFTGDEDDEDITNS